MPRVVFMGTPEFAVPSLAAVAESCALVGVVTQPDRPRGRGLEPAASPVATVAQELGVPLLKPERVNTEDSRAAIGALKPDLLAVVAYGAILSPALLRVPAIGAINLHGSLLPEYRGASPVQRALWDGRAATGVTTLWMDEGIDTGDCILQRWAPIEAQDDVSSLALRLAAIGAPLLAESLNAAHAGRAPRHPQGSDGASYAPRLEKHDGLIDWGLPAETVWNHQRAVTPWPGAVTRFRGRALIVIRAEPLSRLEPGAPPGTILHAGGMGVDVACASGAVRLARVKPEGKSDMNAADWARGARLESGDRFAALETVA